MPPPRTVPVLLLSMASIASVACAASSPTTPDPAIAPPPPGRSAGAVAAPATARPAASASAPEAPTASPEDIWRRVGSDLTECYEHGRRAIPTMTSGKVTLHGAVDPGGRATCIVPGDDTGLTPDVEDCMRERLGRETFPPAADEWSFALPVAVRDGRVALGQVSTQPTMEMIESQNLSEEIYEVVERLLPQAKQCLRGIDRSGGRRVVHVGAQVGKTGAVECALASSASPLPAEVRRCVAGVFTRATFKPPKKGHGLLSVPIELSKN